MTTLASAALAVAMIAALILTVGAIRTLRHDRKRGLLMLTAGLVILGNVLVWTV